MIKQTKLMLTGLSLAAVMAITGCNANHTTPMTKEANMITAYANIAYSNLNSVQDLSEHIMIRNKKINYGSMIISVADLPIMSAQKKLSKAPTLNENDELIRSEFAPNKT